MSRRGENIYKRKDGRWEGRYKDSTSKYHSVYAKSYLEVREKLKEYKTRPVSVSSGKMTVKMLFDEWLSAVKLKVKESTYANYRMKADKHILPEFSDLRYDCLTVGMVHDLISEKLNSGLSAKYVCDIIIVFKCMSKYAARVHGFRNILADVVLPKVQKKELNLLSANQQSGLCRYLLKNMNPTSLCVFLSLYTGLRVGEICGLMWGDIDFQKSTITVRRTVQRVYCNEHGTKLRVGTPKSNNSQRIIPVPDFVMDILRKFRKNNNFYVLSGSVKLNEPRTIQRRFKAILKKADLPSINFHGLRHMFATNCISVGFDVKTLSEILGHASTETTLNRYVHSSMDRKKVCMSLLRPAA